MGGVTARAVDTATRALTDRKADLCDEVMVLENEIDALNLAIESRATQLLALQQPMARDLRTIAGVLRMISDIERIGDYSVDICRQAQALAGQSLFTELVDIPRMAVLVQNMLSDALRAFVDMDLDLAMKAVKQDDEVDHLYRTVHHQLIGHIQRQSSVAPQAIALLLVATYLERMADHVTNIGERIWFIQTGEMKELHE